MVVNERTIFRQSLEALICDIEAERERDMAITSPTRPMFYVPPKPFGPTQCLPFNLPSPMPANDGDAADLDFGFLTGHDDFSQFDVPPLTDDMDCDFSHDTEFYAELDQLIAQAFPDGIPEEVDWTPFPELNALISNPYSSDDMAMAPSLAPPESLDESIFEDESFRKTFEEFDAVFGQSLSHLNSSESSFTMEEI